MTDMDEGHHIISMVRDMTDPWEDFHNNEKPRDLTDEQKGKEIARDQLIAADRRAHANQNALEEARTLLEQSDRSRRMVEQELADTNESLGEQTCTNQAIQVSKMKLDNEMQTLSVIYL